MTTYAEVAVNAPIPKTFHYHVPDHLSDELARGSLVRVSFGTGAQPAIVVALHDALPADLDDIQTKPVIDLLDPYPVMTTAHLALAEWMQSAYLTAPGASLWLMLPPGITGKSAKRVRLLDANAEGQTPLQARILAALRADAPLTLKQLQKKVDSPSQTSLLRHLRQMQTAGWLTIDAVLSTPTTKKKTVATVIRTVDDADVIAALDSLSRAPKQRIVFDYIARFDYPLDVHEVYETVAATRADLNNLAARGLVQLGERIVFRDSLADRGFIPSHPPPLTNGQQRAWQVLQRALADDTRAHKFLLHGVTGSGKTEIYLHAIADVIERGQQAIFLVPEIALTPQTIRRVAQRFPDQVAVVHGSLSKGERYDTWRRARAGEIGVIVGTRSALFTPLPDIGLIILDEEHDPSYKQAPPINPPYYHARHVAERLTELTDAVLILGSATPDVESYYRAQQGDLQYLHLPRRIMGHRQRVTKQAQRQRVRTAYQPAENEAMMIDLPPVKVVDMRAELKAGNTSMFSRDLHEALTDVLARDEQAILFLNRRGQSTYVFCRDCGYVAECENCDTALTYHRQGTALRCHHCGHQAPVPDVCPACAGRRIRYFGAGTQQVEAHVQATFPQATIVRWDADTATRPDLHEQVLARFARQEANVMIGTQMVAKGLDLPMVTLVGVVSADPGLALPDFRADERAFQLLTQVAGRAGRGLLGGRVILQTYQPRHPSVVAASHHDYAQFYQTTIDNRREVGYPPFRRMGRVLIQHPHPIEAERECQQAAAWLRQHIARQQLTDTTLIGPAPCFFSRIDRHYRWHVLVRSVDPTQALRDLPARQGWYVDIDPLDVL
jgi:primosomal protein N' (replication factor Y) (superfamily II helicase)